MRTLLASAFVGALVTTMAPAPALAQGLVGGGGGETAGAAPAAAATEAPLDGVMPAEAATDVAEKDHKTYYFVGLRYRGNYIPKAMVNIFVDEGAAFFSNMVGLEVDIRKDRFSLIPALNYVEYGFGNTLFAEKGKDQNNAGNWSMVSSSLKAAYLTLDLLWSTPVHKNIDFEYGIGVGVGALFGNLNNNWVTTAAQTGAPSVKASNGLTYYQCQATGPAGGGCNTLDHSNATVAKVGGYTESKWSDGGSVPNVFLHLSLPQLGIRIKPVKQFEARIGLGFSLTGFWFGMSGDYGLEQPERAKAPAAHETR